MRFVRLASSRLGCSLRRLRLRTRSAWEPSGRVTNSPAAGFSEDCPLRRSIISSIEYFSGSLGAGGMGRRLGMSESYVSADGRISF